MVIDINGSFRGSSQTTTGTCMCIRVCVHVHGVCAFLTSWEYSGFGGSRGTGEVVKCCVVLYWGSSS